LTEDKFNNFTINKDYSIENYDEFSGSEADSAALALRMAIAKVSRIGKFNSIILDEVAASFDTNKENLLLELLKTTTNQIIYISHGELN
jgi:DNA repair exonuclease SbcCD ATPase subunit